MLANTCAVLLYRAEHVASSTYIEQPLSTLRLRDQELLEPIKHSLKTGVVCNVLSTYLKNGGSEALRLYWAVSTLTEKTSGQASTSVADLEQAPLEMGSCCSDQRQASLRPATSRWFSEREEALRTDLPSENVELARIFAEGQRIGDEDPAMIQESGGRGEGAVARVPPAKVRSGQPEGSKKPKAGGQSQIGKSSDSGGASQSGNHGEIGQGYPHQHGGKAVDPNTGVGATLWGRP